jgi:hypothetical protein
MISPETARLLFKKQPEAMSGTKPDNVDTSVHLDENNP